MTKLIDDLPVKIKLQKTLVAVPDGRAHVYCPRLGVRVATPLDAALGHRPTLVLTGFRDS